MLSKSVSRYVSEEAQVIVVSGAWCSRKLSEVAQRPQPQPWLLVLIHNLLTHNGNPHHNQLKATHNLKPIAWQIYIYTLNMCSLWAADYFAISKIGDVSPFYGSLCARHVTIVQYIHFTYTVHRCTSTLSHHSYQGSSTHLY